MSGPTASGGGWLGLDIGGANLKAAHESGPSLSIRFPLWKYPERLTEALDGLIRRLPAVDRFAVTMTAELCDCFPDKAEGVRAVLDAVISSARGRPIRVWGIDSSFHDLDDIRLNPHLAAASNWLALAEVVARLLPKSAGLLIDVGSTTTDIIPLAGGRARPRGRTDTERLGTGELVYAGVRRTPLCAVAAELPFRGVPTGLAAELFATTADVYLTLGSIADDPADLDTADGRPVTLEAALSRLARMVGADRRGFTAADAVSFSQAADAAMLARLGSAGRRVIAACPVPPEWAAVAGSGEFLARRLARLLLPPGSPLVSLSERWGPEDSTAACARALVILARDRLGSAG